MTFLVLSAVFFAPPPGNLSAEVGKESITVKDGDKVVTTYVFAGTVQQERSTDRMPLSKPYFYPLVPPNGLPVTRPWPMERGTKGETVDHFHQKSAWFCHGDVIPEGIELKNNAPERGTTGVDFWAETPPTAAARKGRIVHVGWVGTPGTTFVEQAEWRAPGDVKILDEVRTVAVTKTDHGYLIAYDTELTASVCPITFGDTKEGSMGVRVRNDFTLKTGSTGVITSSDGQEFKKGAKDPLAIWGKPADWNDYSGTADGKTAGVAIFDHPQNKYRALWHTRDYGLMAANPFGRNRSGFPSQKGKTDLAKLAKGDTLKLKYALYVHDGDAKAGKVAEAYAAYAK